ncbi:hypothetical protein ABH920_008069 [Catenulispora sp. EB89]|uniref:DUF6153 family protein n=1 Tax=Catenulispora sp. EB89 TaxID=3156257 RepID=UPI003518B574
MAAGAGRRRAMLLFTVLAGLFLMHGLSAPSMHGMPIPASSHMASVMPPHADAPATDGDPGPMSDHMQADMTCVPLRPEGLSGLFLALFLIVIALWRPRLAFRVCLIGPRWPHGPPRHGIQILRELSVSRT